MTPVNPQIISEEKKQERKRKEKWLYLQSFYERKIIHKKKEIYMQVIRTRYDQ